MRASNIQYINGNYFVQIKGWNKSYRALRQDDPIFKSDFPDSIDLKITNCCSIGCKYCHESSIPNGKHFNLQNTIKILSELPKVGIELAIGGGCILEMPENDLIGFLKWCKDNNFLIRATINSKDLLDKKKLKFIEKLKLTDRIEAFGISIDDPKNCNFEMIEDIFLYNKIVYHIIAGVYPINEIEKLLNKNYRSILILGYKNWGRGENFQPKLDNWKKEITRIAYGQRKMQSCSISFDNLAIEQLGVKDILTQSEWDTYYMGPEFSHSMYVDAVTEVFAPTSRSAQRVKWQDSKGILDYYKNNRTND